MKKAVILSLVLLAVLTGCSLSKTSISLSPEEVKTKAEKFINENLMQPGTTAAVQEVTEEGGLYKLAINLGNGQIIDSFMTKDGKKFFPQVMDIEEIEGKNQAQEGGDTVQPADVVKSDKPKIELFVMSHCPYGTQIEKGILPVVEALGEAIDFELKFCDYAMHGQKELNEQMRQYCIQKNEPQKLPDYLECFLEVDDSNQSAKCVQQLGINQTNLNQCVAATDKEFQVTEKFNDKATWMNGQFPVFEVDKGAVAQYQIQGSPGLVVNSTKVASGRSPAALLTVICSAFNEAPQACSGELSTTTPSPGFGFGGEGADSGGECN
ncbi:hypothetical protein KKD19_03930 [Patescibacteria group bacterium]|nr:hypothetical protein [Patescibacteria group bacterium]